MQQGERFHFARGIQVLLRPPNAIQFGLDAMVVGVFESTAKQARKLAQQCRDLNGSHTFTELVALFADCDMEELAAAALVEDLIHHGVLQRAVTLPAVAVIGSHPIRPLLTDALQREGYRERQRGENEALSSFLARLLPTDVLIALNPPAQAPEFSASLANHPTVVPVHTRDGRGYIGPLIVGGVGACLMCWELHLAAQDPYWHELRKQYRSDLPATTTVLLHTAAQVGTTLESLHASMLAPGIPARQVIPGQLLVVLPTGEVQQRHIPEHVTCPVCWGRRNAH